MVKIYRVHLTGQEQEEPKGLVSKGREAAYRQTHARILLLRDAIQAQWRFTTGDARIKLKSIYHQYNSCRLIGWSPSRLGR